MVELQCYQTLLIGNKVHTPSRLKKIFLKSWDYKKMFVHNGICDTVKVTWSWWLFLGDGDKIELVTYFYVDAWLRDMWPKNSNLSPMSRTCHQHWFIIVQFCFPTFSGLDSRLSSWNGAKVWLRSYSDRCSNQFWVSDSSSICVII